MAQQSFELNNDIKECLNSPGRRYIVNDYVKEHFEKKYQYVPYDLRLHRHAADHYGGNSDCYIMYAIAKLGLCDIGAIQAFLKAYKKKNPDLAILDVTNRSTLRGRLSVLHTQGFLFRHIYETNYIYENTERTDKIHIYSIDKDSQNFMTQRLGKRVPPNIWIQAKSIEDIISWAASCSIGMELAQNDAFSEFKEGIFKTKNLGTCFLPCELKMEKDGKEYYTIVLPSFLHFSKERMTQEDYLESIFYKMNTILNYINYRGFKNKESRIVIAVEDYYDLQKIADVLLKTEPLHSYLGQIYFTSEGLINKTTTIMLQLKRSNGKVELVTKKVDFLQ